MLNGGEQTADGYMILDSCFIPVRPSVNANLPRGTTHLQLPANVLIPWFTMPTVWHIPGKLDEARLREAVAELTSWWPLLGGRYVRRPTTDPAFSNFAIHLTASPIPYESAEYTTDQPPFPTRNVIQPSLDPFMPSLARDFLFADSDAALFAIRHTVLRPANESVLALCISHLLVDGDSFSRLIQHLSFLYCNPGSPLERPPTFFARPLWSAWPPMEDLIEANRTRIDFLCDTVSEQLTLAAEFAASSEEVNVFLSGEEVGYIKGRYGVRGGSSNDALCGWLLDLLERVGEVNDFEALMTANYRNWHPDSGVFPPGLVDQYGTAAAFVTVAHEHPPAPDRPTQIAQMIRNSVNRYRTDINYATEQLTVEHFLWQRAAEAGKIYLFAARPNQVILNSTTRYDWQPAFGQESRSAVHTIFTARRYIRIWRSNPEVGERASASSGALEINFGIAHGLEEPFYRLLESEKGKWSEAV